MDKSFMHHSLQALHCPQCGSSYTNSQIGLVQESEANILATITCDKCQHQSVVTLTLGQAAPNFTSDLRPVDVTRFVEYDPLSANDLLDVYAYLKKTKGDFKNDFALLNPDHKAKAPKTSKKTKPAT